jgi:PleD family two-component response regulator
MRETLYKRGNELKAAHARIEELAQVDELTGLLNRRYITKTLNEEMARAQCFGAACSVAIIDLDFFKRINDQFGHPVGDEVLRTFAITLSVTAKDQAVRTLDRLRSIASEVDWAAISRVMNVTMSAGISEVRQEDSAADILARADAALYNAKDAGRNRVIAA